LPLYLRQIPPLGPRLLYRYLLAIVDTDVISSVETLDGVGTQLYVAVLRRLIAKKLAVDCVFTDDDLKPSGNFFVWQSFFLHAVYRQQSVVAQVVSFRYRKVQQWHLITSPVHNNNNYPSNNNSNSNKIVIIL